MGLAMENFSDQRAKSADQPSQVLKGDAKKGKTKTPYYFENVAEENE